MQEEIRSLGIKQNERHTQQQVGVLGRLLQRDREILLQSADAVKHGVAAGIERVAGLFQRVAAGEVMVERFTVLCILFAVVGGKAAQRDRDQVAALLQILDDGRITDSQGRTVDFKNTVIVMTSNIGAKALTAAGAKLGFDGSDKKAEEDADKASITNA